MKYQGGKGRMGRHIAPQILATAWSIDAETYLEPFLGSAAVFAKVAPYFRRAIGSDAHHDLILMWQAARGGWVPPTAMSEDDWLELKTAEPSALRGFAGFACSFGGKWFSGYARDERGDDHAGAGSRSVTRTAKKLGGAELQHCDYQAHTLNVGPRTVVYCDPPYRDTCGYNHVGKFDSDEFWSTMVDWHNRGASVIVSEYSAPPEWESVWSTLATVTMDNRSNINTAVEHLFRHREAPPL